MRISFHTGLELRHRRLRIRGVGIRLWVAMWAGAAGLLAVTVVLAATGDISTVAGILGQPGSTGDDGAATSAKLSFPSGVAVDLEGNLYIADQSTHTIRKVTKSTGIISTVAGQIDQQGSTGDTGPATGAKLFSPSDVAVDSDGNIYISDNRNEVIRKVTKSTGNIDTVAGQIGLQGSSGDGGAATSAELNNPFGLAVDSEGNIFIADKRGFAIRKVTKSTSNIDTVAGILGQAGSTGDGNAATSAKLNEPNGVAVDSSGNIYIADTNNHVIRKVTKSTGIITTVAGTIGQPGSTGDDGPATSAKIDTPFGVAVDAVGNIFIPDFNNHAVRKVTESNGIISTVAGTIGVPGLTGDGGAATSATLTNPQRVAVDFLGNLFIADLNNQAIRKVERIAALVPGLSHWGLIAMAVLLASVIGWRMKSRFAG